MSEPAPPARPFYVTGGTLKPGEPSYVERRADTDLFASLLAGDFCYVLTARQMGKSSLMARTAKRLGQSGIAAAIVDLTQIGSERGTEVAAQWYFGVANKIHQQLGITAPLRPWWQERSDLSSVQRLTDFFRELVLAHVPGRIVVFVDEIDSTIGLPFADDFFAALRACYNARATDDAFERLTFVLLGVATPDQLIRDPTRTPFNIGKRIDLTDFTMDEAQVLAPGLHADSTEAGRRLDRVLHWTAGHPYLTQAVCRAVRDKGDTGTAEEAVDPQVTELFLSARAQREETNLKHARARLERRGPEGRRLLQLYQRVRQGKVVADQPTSPLFAQLKLAGVAKATDEGRLAVRNRIYEEVFSPGWVKAAMPVDRGRQLAVATLAAAFVGALVWYAIFQPRPYEDALRTAMVDDGYTTAEAAYEKLRANPFARAKATELMQEFWEKRALRYAMAGKRDESLLSCLKGLELKDNERLRRQAQNLVSTDYESLRRTLRHARRVRAVAFSPDGGAVLTGSDDDTARHWDAHTGRPVTAPLQHQGNVVAVAFSPDGETVVTKAFDGIHFWSARTGKSLTVPLRNWDLFVPSDLGEAVSPDGETVLTTDRDTARLWDARSRPLRTAAEREDAVVATAISPDGEAVLTGSLAGMARLWSARTGKPLTAPLRHQGDVLAVAFSPDRGIVITGSGDGTARLWDARSGKPITSPLQHLRAVWAVAFSPDGGTALTGSLDNTARLWDVRTGKLLAVPLQHQEEVWAVAFSPDGRTVLTGSVDGTACLWDVRTGKRLVSLEQVDLVSTVAFSPDGETLLVGADSVRLWDARSARQLGPPLELWGFIGTIAFNPTGKVFFVATNRWLHTFSWDGKKVVHQNSQVLPGFWTKGFRFPADCDGCVQVVLEDPGEPFRLQTLRLDGPTDPPIEGDPKALLEKWQARLGLKFDDQMRPVPTFSP